MRPPFDSVQLVEISPMSLWFMVFITIVTGAYKRRNPHPIYPCWGVAHGTGPWRCCTCFRMRSMVKTWISNGGRGSNGNRVGDINGTYMDPMDPSTFLGSVWNIIYYNLEAFFVPSQTVAMDP